MFSLYILYSDVLNNKKNAGPRTKPSSHTPSLHTQRPAQCQGPQHASHCLGFNYTCWDIVRSEGQSADRAEQTARHTTTLCELTQHWE